MKALIMIGMIIGSSIGSYIPIICGGGLLSMSSVFFGGLGGLIGVWVGYRIANQLDL